MSHSKTSRFACSFATRHALGVFLTGLLLSNACQPGGPDEPEPVKVLVRIHAASGVNPTGPLRLAAIWLTDSGDQVQWVTTLDEPVAKLNGVQVVTLQLPPKAVRASLIERSEGDLSCGEESGYFVAGVVMPRFVVYEDLDQNGSFNPSLPSRFGADRVWATTRPNYDSKALVAFEDLDRALSQEPTEIAECVREHTNGQYTAFFLASIYSSYVIPTDAAPSVELELSSTDFPRVALGCDSVISSVLSDYVQKTYTTGVAIVDTHVVGDTCASATTYTCSAGDVSSSLPSSFGLLQYPGYARSFMCTVAGSLDVLWKTESRIVCDGCACNWTQSDAAWVVESSKAPANWPCGNAVRYCGTPQTSVWNRPSYCAILSTKRPL